MINMRNLLLVFLTFFSITAWSDSSSVLWYDSPASFFEESLVIGNGKSGATIFGKTNREVIWLNDIT